jgi:hypothetical protein
LKVKSETLIPLTVVAALAKLAKIANESIAKTNKLNDLFVIV